MREHEVPDTQSPIARDLGSGESGVVDSIAQEQECAVEDSKRKLQEPDEPSSCKSCRRPGQLWSGRQVLCWNGLPVSTTTSWRMSRYGKGHVMILTVWWYSHYWSLYVCTQLWIYLITWWVFWEIVNCHVLIWFMIKHLLVLSSWLLNYEFFSGCVRFLTAVVFVIIEQALCPQLEWW